MTIHSSNLKCILKVLKRDPQLVLFLNSWKTWGNDLNSGWHGHVLCSLWFVRNRRM